MVLPICEICAKSGVLCSACESKLQKGKISETDVELSKILHELGQDIGFDHAINTENVIIVVTAKDQIGNFIGKGGDNLKILSDKLGKQLKVIGRGSLEETIHDFVAPVKVLGINTVFKPDGSTTKRVRVRSKDKKKLRMSPEEMEKLIKSLTDGEIEILFE
ncbi:MAG: KH domain-containing protein [Candidatus Altiarchaeales archaeon]|nr:KH domain-containing protein [Candidatus Altiarchaeota archaeon]MBU4341180.1 KH domain-containing protein [Candidatus Altiarchaeota archaeon]MBU4406101.1 KH domain-containing protein [Candidatus Altiarchaeota archaeon]MCG2782869.1 KH domain-containing protein [Candidatus Altiarchaeales archaeon]